LSEIRATTISDETGNGPIALTKQSAAKSWVNFNGTGTIAIRDSLNVSSLTDNSTANYYVNFANNMASEAYHVSNSTAGNGTDVWGFANTSTAGSYEANRIHVILRYVANNAGSTNAADRTTMTTSAHGDLA